jgi:uncharacterized protein
MLIWIQVADRWSGEGWSMGAAERADLHGQHKLSNCATAGCAPFQQRWPWIGPDLQTLRDTLRPQRLPPDQGVPLLVPMAQGDQLLMLAEQPAGPPPRAWVLLVHGLGGDSGRPGVRRLAQALLAAGFGVLRLNLRGAGAGRALAAGTYAAACNSDLLPVLAAARQRAGDRPLLGVGLSLGGTVLLNALLACPDGLDGLACVSSPLDLAACSRQIDSPRNLLYQRVLLAGLIRLTLADPRAQPCREALGAVRSIRQFDAAITAPRWGYRSVEHYYRQASPLLALGGGAAVPPTLLLHAQDDPWVPAAAVLGLAAQAPPRINCCLPAHGGHNGFHGRGGANWADCCVVEWLARCGG